jgi:predicted DNA-binding ribbon-helix-helix protein
MYTNASLREGEVMSSIRKRSVAIGGHKTSVSLEDEFWKCLRHIASTHGKTLGELLAEINANREYANLSSAIRLFVVRYYLDQLNKQMVETSSRGLPLTSTEHSTQ